MGKSKVGERYSISIAVIKPGNDANKDVIVFNDASVTQLEFNLPLNHLPYGTATVTGKAESAGVVASGAYGKLMFEGLSADNVIEMPMYVNSATRKNVSPDVVSVDLSFTVGSEAMHGVMDSVALEGTSVEAICKLFKTINVDVVDEVTPIKGANGISDNMVWRFTGGTITDYLQTVVEHASIPGDILYWAYDDSRLTAKVGTFNVSRAAKNKNFMMYTNDAITTTSSATRKVKGTDTSVWYYAGYTPSDLTGVTREARSPNLMIDSTVSGSDKDVGICSKECWRTVLGSMGAKDDFYEKSAYGKQYVVKPFPSNTHKTYAVAPFVRNYLLAEYTKMVRLRIFNHPGPSVGSCIHFYAASAKKDMGDFLPDENYTARYIVVGKQIIKNSTIGTGLLGKERPSTTTDLVTELTMISNAGYGGAVGPDFKLVMGVADSVTSALQKETKK